MVKRLASLFFGLLELEQTSAEREFDLADATSLGGVEEQVRRTLAIRRLNKRDRGDVERTANVEYELAVLNGRKANELVADFGDSLRVHNAVLTEGRECAKVLGDVLRDRAFDIENALVVLKVARLAGERRLNVEVDRVCGLLCRRSGAHRSNHCEGDCGKNACDIEFHTSDYITSCINMQLLVV